MAGLSGFTGLQPVIVTDPGASPQETHGGPANAAHGQQFWEQPPRYPWLLYGADPALGAATADTALLGQGPEQLPAGADSALGKQAVFTGSHGAPWPSFGVEDSVVSDREQAARRQQLNQDLRALPMEDDLRRRGTSGYGNKMELAVEADYVTAGQALLQPVPGQMRGQMGRDRVQGFAPLNSYGFDSAHVRRPRYRSRIPGNFAWLTGRQRPMIVNAVGRQTYPVGEGSPFEGQVPGVGSVDGAILTNLPPTYSPPPPAPTGPPVSSEGDPAWGWSVG